MLFVGYTSVTASPSGIVILVQQCCVWTLPTSKAPSLCLRGKAAVVTGPPTRLVLCHYFPRWENISDPLTVATMSQNVQLQNRAHRGIVIPFVLPSRGQHC